MLIERKIFDQNMHQCIPPSLPGVLGTVFFKTRKFPTGLKPGRTILLDFDLIERAVEAKAPKEVEWLAGFGLLLTTIWVYLEILRLLAKIRSK